MLILIALAVLGLRLTYTIHLSKSTEIVLENRLFYARLVIPNAYLRLTSISSQSTRALWPNLDPVPRSKQTTAQHTTITVKLGNVTVPRLWREAVENTYHFGDHILLEESQAEGLQQYDLAPSIEVPPQRVFVSEPTSDPKNIVYIKCPQPFRIGACRRDYQHAENVWVSYSFPPAAIGDWRTFHEPVVELVSGWLKEETSKAR